MRRRVMISIIAGAIFLIGLILTIKLGIVNELGHYKFGVCNITDCNIKMDICCVDGKECVKCYIVNIIYDLSVTDVMYVKSDVINVYDVTFCNQTNIKCHYNERSISQSLQLKPHYPVGLFALVIAMLLSISFTISIVATILNCYKF